MLIRDVMNRNVITIQSEVSAREAAKIMSKNQIGSLVVIDENKIMGILTETDIVKKIVSEDRDLDETKIKDIMTEKVLTIEPDKKVEDAVSMMTQNKIKRLPVVENEEVIGIITTSDIIVVEPKLIEAVAGLISLKIPGYQGG